MVGANSGWLLGYPEKVLTLGSQTLDLAESIGAPIQRCPGSRFRRLGFICLAANQS